MEESIHQTKYTCDTCGKKEICSDGEKKKNMWGKTKTLRLVGFSYGDNDGVKVLTEGDFCSKKCFDEHVEKVNLVAILQEKGWPENWLEVRKVDNV